jgi:WD40 repeat protein
VFAPQSSLVKAAFQHCLPGWLTQPPVTAQTWRTDALRLEAEGRFVAMAFSPDDKYIATCSDNGTVRIWDPETGEHLSTSDTSGQDERLERCAALTFSGRNSLAKASFFLADHKEPGAALSYKIVIFQSIELRDTKEVTCAALGVYDAKLAFAPGDHDILYAAMNRRLDDIFAQDLWRLTIGLGTTERIWSRSKSISDDRDDRVWVFGVSAELGLVAYCSGDSNILDLVDLYSGASMRKLNLMSLAIHTGHSIFHGTGLIVAISDYEKWPPHGLHSFDVKTGQRCLVDSSSKSYEAFSMAHRGDRLALVLYNSANGAHDSAELLARSHCLSRRRDIARSIFGSLRSADFLGWHYFHAPSDVVHTICTQDLVLTQWHFRRCTYMYRYRSTWDQLVAYRLWNRSLPTLRDQR